MERKNFNLKSSKLKKDVIAVNNCIHKNVQNYKEPYKIVIKLRKLILPN